MIQEEKFPSQERRVVCRTDWHCQKLRVHTHCHQKRNYVIKLILHLAEHMRCSAPCIQVYWINKFSHCPGSLSSLEGEWRWLSLWSSPNSSYYLHCWVPPGDNRVQGQLNTSGCKSSFFGLSFAHENSCQPLMSRLERQGLLGWSVRKNSQRID